MMVKIANTVKTHYVKKALSYKAYGQIMIWNILVLVGVTLQFDKRVSMISQGATTRSTRRTLWSGRYYTDMCRAGLQIEMRTKVRTLRLIKDLSASWRYYSGAKLSKTT